MARSLSLAVSFFFLEFDELDLFVDFDPLRASDLSGAMLECERRVGSVKATRIRKKGEKW